MSVFRVSRADAGDFENGRLAWDVLHQTASHRTLLAEEIDLSQCVMLKPYTVACLAALGARKALVGQRMRLRMPDDQRCAEHLNRIGMGRWFDSSNSLATEGRDTNLVAEQLHHRSGDFADRVIRGLTDQLGLSVNVACDLANHLDEVVLNALTHADSSIGCVVVGQAFPASRFIEIAVVDLGQTIRGHLTANPAHHAVDSDEAAIIQATQESVTGTVGLNRWGEPNSGVGLFELRQYCEGAGGSLSILSGGSIVSFGSDNPPRPTRFRGYFAGSLVNVRFLHVSHCILEHRGRCSGIEMWEHGAA